jgi:hypothetical protein
MSFALVAADVSSNTAMAVKRAPQLAVLPHLRRLGAILHLGHRADYLMVLD